MLITIYVLMNQYIKFGIQICNLSKKDLELYIFLELMLHLKRHNIFEKMLLSVSYHWAHFWEFKDHWGQTTEPLFHKPSQCERET